MAYGRYRRSYGGRRRGYGRRRRFGYGFRRSFRRFRTRYRTIFRTRYRTRYKQARRRRRGYSRPRGNNMIGLFKKLAIAAVFLFGIVWLWNNFLKAQVIKLGIIKL